MNTLTIRKPIVFVAMLVIAAGVLAACTTGDDRQPGATPNTPDEPRTRTFTGMVIRYTGQFYNGTAGDLVAQDPNTGETITLAAASDFRDNTIAWSAASADGRWVAFESAFCSDRPSVKNWERRSGLWVTNGTDEPRQLTAPCTEGSEPSDYWAWSPTGSKLAVVVRSPGEAPALILIDPATADRTDLGTPAGDVTSLAWSPDGTRIAYGTVPTGSPDGTTKGSVYVVSVDGGNHALIAESLGYVPGGEEGAGIQWSPDGTRIAVLAYADPGLPGGTLYVMNADGSDRRALAEGVNIEHTLGSPNVVWSPEGTRIAYSTDSDEHDPFRIWSAAVDGSDPVIVMDAADAAVPTRRANGLAGGPVWSPDGTRIAFRYSRTWPDVTWFIANADGSGDIHEIDELQALSWRGGWYFCVCYG
jgi:Tol biopolymer transport system component